MVSVERIKEYQETPQVFMIMYDNECDFDYDDYGDYGDDIDEIMSGR